ncbi:hypothetical protein ODE01S_16620 [Oceanithermus desulfurans NBRC 100063]|uniref:Uncharacterized protein n=1 Tax=Oceanithermus desulfurans NBRC 100063 TaxID=1227550 RepID=A0A511RKP7_9DEIN|nr:hypothetical protein ODE01S_16620 [Oceanithermus desulfurans NBRC 100063]
MVCGLWFVACGLWFVAGTRGLRKPVLPFPPPTPHDLFATYHALRTTYYAPPPTTPLRRLRRRLPQGGGREESAASGLRNRVPPAVGSVNGVLGGYGWGPVP